MVDACLLDGILDSLEDIGYSGPLLEDGALRTAVEQGLASPEFVDLCLSLCSEIKALLHLQESVTRPQGPEDAESFQLEMRAFLQELSCPHSQLTEALQSLSSYTNKLMLIDFLLSELLALRLVVLRKKEEPKVSEKEGAVLPYSVPANLAAILKVYQQNNPPPHITVKQIFDRIIQKTREAVGGAPNGYLNPGLVTQPLTLEQCASLDRINETLTKEYSVRRQMLLTRCDVTVQSFRWSDRVKGKEDELTAVYQARRQKLRLSAPVSVARVLAAKEDLITINKTSNMPVCEGSVAKVLIGKVPDRGGRPQETRLPAMPAFKRRTEGPQERRDGGYRGGWHGGRGGRGGKGGRVQGGWSGGHGGGQGRGGGGGWRGGYHGNQQWHGGGGGGQQY